METCKHGSGAGSRKPTAEMRQGAECRAYLLSDKKNASGDDGGSPDDPNGSGGGEDGDNNGEAPDPAE